MELNDRQLNIITQLYMIVERAEALMKIAETGTDGNLKEMSYHIKCYSGKIASHLLKTWNLNERIAKRKSKT